MAAGCQPAQVMFAVCASFAITQSTPLLFSSWWGAHRVRWQGGGPAVGQGTDLPGRARDCHERIPGLLQGGVLLHQRRGWRGWCGIVYCRLQSLTHFAPDCPSLPTLFSYCATPDCLVAACNHTLHTGIPAYANKDGIFVRLVARFRYWALLSARSFVWSLM